MVTNSLQKVNLFAGRFQPFHNGHLQCCKDALKKNGLKTVIMFIHNNKFDSKKPFSDELIEKELSIVKKNNSDCIADIVWLRFPQPVRMCRVLKDMGYEAVLWLSGEDRYNSYAKQLNSSTTKSKIENELEVSVPELFATTRYGSATAVREAIKNDDFQEFERLMPKDTDKLYEEFKEQLSAVMYESNISSGARKSLSTYLYESLISEGGHSIDNAEPIRGDIARNIYNDISSNIYKNFKGVECEPLGSTIKKTSSQYTGDIDIAINYSWDDRNNILDFLRKEYNCEVGNINNSLHVLNIGYVYTDENGDNKIAQVDFMFVDDVDFAKFAYNSPAYGESRFKGMYQSILFMSIVENTPVLEYDNKYITEYFKGEFGGKYDGEIKTYWKFRFNQNKGLILEQKSYVGKTKRTSNPTTVKGSEQIITKNIDKIISVCLGPKANKNTCKTFESELDFIFSDNYIYRSTEQLNKIKSSFFNDWQFKLKTSNDINIQLRELWDEKFHNLR